MTEKIYYLASAPFEAACQINILPENHPAAQLHGHSYTTSIRMPFTTLQQNSHFAAKKKEAVSFLKNHLQSIIEPLNYTDLNQQISVPTDENLARWIHKKITSSGMSHNKIDRVAIQSTHDSGVDLDNNPINYPMSLMDTHAAECMAMDLK